MIDINKINGFVFKLNKDTVILISFPDWKSGSITDSENIYTNLTHNQIVFVNQNLFQHNIAVGKNNELEPVAVQDLVTISLNDTVDNINKNGDLPEVIESIIESLKNEENCEE